MKSSLLAVMAAMMAVIATPSAMAQVSFPSTGYSQNFDSLGTSGTTAPTGWTCVAISGANSAWTTSIPASGATSAATAGTANATLVVNSAAATASISSATQGYNLALAASTSDRCLGTSPTGTAGEVLQLSLTNTTGAAVNALSIGYDTRRFNAVATVNELPGYWLFYSLDSGTTWTNVSAVNPTITTVPNTVGVTNTPATAFTLSSAWASNATLMLRWIDDNAQQTSPDQLIGLDNVTIATSTANVPPTVSLSAPTAGASFVTGSTVTLTATAADSDGTVSKVDFYQGATKLGTATTSPYSFAWTNVAAGSYSLTAVATDNSGATTTSSAVAITVVTLPAISFASSYTETFDSMGTGTAPPSGWSFFGYTAGGNNTWTTSIPATDVAGGGLNQTLLSTTTFDATNTKSATQGYNFALSTSTTDRALGTSPTSTEGVALQLNLTNTSGSAISTLQVGYDIRRFDQGLSSSTPTDNELPGYWLFYSLDNGATWTNVSPLNPVISGSSGVVVPNTVGVTTVVPTSFNLGSAWAAGSSLLLRWVDDNAVATSPDQIIGLDNVSLSAGTPNVLPTVALTSPAASATFDAPATISLAATAADSDGTVAKVDFYQGATKLGTATSAPYTFSWTGVFTGTYSLTAVATDNAGGTTTSAPVSITVTNTDNVPPSVTLTSPEDNTSLSAGTVTLTASASDSDGTIAKVDFYQGSTKLGTATTAPYSLVWAGASAGSYSLTAVATDNDGAATTSSVSHITVTQAVGGSFSFTENFDSMGASGTALPAGWSFYSLSGTHDDFSYAPPQTSTFVPNSTGTALNVGPGSDTATANATLIAANDPSTQKSAQGYNFGLSASPTDRCFGSSPSGNAASELQLSLSNTTGAALTAITIGYDIRRFTTTTNTNATYDTGPYKGVEELPGYWLFYSLDNGSTWTNVSALNPTLTGPSGVIVPNSVGTTNVPPTQVSLGNAWAAGANLLLRWVDDNAESPSPDQIIALDNVSVTAGAVVGSPPTVAISSPASGAAFTAPATVAITATAADSDGTVTKVDFYNGTTLLGTATAAPYSYSWTSVATGTYSLTAKATDNDGNVTASTAVAITVAGTGSPPTVSLTAPANAATFTAPATVSLTATAADSDGTVTKVDFYNGSTLLGTATASPYSYSWTNVAAGTYTLSAVATDNGGNATTSSTVSITVNSTAGSGTLTRGPYLQMASPTAMTVRWRSSQSIVGRVRYGSSAASLTSFVDETAATTEHIVRLTGLTAATTYFYSIGSAGDTLLGDTTTTFTTSPVTGPAVPTRMWVLGDAGTSSTNQSAVRDAFYNWTGTRTPDMVLQLGDNAYNSGLDTEFQTAVFNMYTTMLRKSPFWSCLGNHETNQATTFVDTYPYFSIYTFPTAGECGGVASGTEHYYSWDYGNIHYISLDSMTGGRTATGAQATWLTNDLASTTATWIIVIFHHPPYTKGSHDSDSETELIEMRQNILPILESGGVDLVLCGHSHSYERSYLLDGHYGLSTTLTASMKKNGGDGRVSGNGAYIKPLTGPRSHSGTVYCVTGSAGQISGGSLNHPAHYTSLNNLGSTVVDISGNQLNLTFLKSDGTTPDTFTMIKQGGTLAPSATTLAATAVTATSATLNASINPNGTATTAAFQYGLTTSYGASSAITLSPVDGASVQSVSVALNGLQPNTKYYFQVTSSNANGTGNGSGLSFTTGALTQAITFASLPDKTYGDAPFNVTATGGGSSSPVTFSILSGPATINGSSVTITGTGSVTVRASQAGDANYLAAPNVDQTFNVAKAAQAISFAALAAKTYGDAAFNLSASGGGSTSAVTFSILSGPATISGSTVTLTGAGTVTIRASQGGDANYLAASNVDQPFTVAKAGQIISVAAIADKTFGVAPFAVSAAGGGGTSPLLVSIASGPATLNGGMVTITGAGSVTLHASQAGDTNYLPATDVNVTFTVAKAAQAITFSAVPDKTYGTAPFDLSATGGASASPVVFSITSGPATINGSTVTLTGAGSVTVTASQAGDVNYLAATPVQQTFAVTKAAQVITFAALPDKTFGTAPFDLVATGGAGTAPVVFSITSGPATINGSTVALTGTGSVTVTASQAGDANYLAATSVDRSFNVTKAGQGITFATLADKTYGDAPFGLTATGGGSTAPVTFSIVSGPATLSGSTVTITGAGSVVVRASQAGDVNHDAATDVDRSFTVAKAAQTLAFGPLADKAFGAAPFSVTATGGAGTAPITFNIVSGPATINGSTITLTGAGSITVRASQAADANYLAASDVDQTFAVTKAAQGITFAALADKTYGDAPFSLSATGGGSTAPVTFSIVSGPATISGSTITLTGAGSITVRASQAGDANHAAATDVDRSFTVAKAVQTLTFDASVPATSVLAGTVTLSATSAQGLTPVLFSVVSGPGSIANGTSLTFTAPGPVVVQAGQAGNANYLAATAQKTITAATDAPLIGVQPQAQIGLIGQPVTFSVTAAGSGTLTYQWLRNGTNIANAKASTYTIAKTTAASIGLYTVAVKNTFGTVSSNAAELVLVDGTDKSLSLAPGGTASLSLTIAGAGLTYQWSKDGTPLSDSSRILGSATSKLSVKLLQRTDAGAYACTVSKTGIGSRAGGVTTLTVSTLKPEISPIDALPDGAVGAPYTYQVQLMPDQPGQTKPAITKFTASGLPLGLTINSAGLISGTPTASATNKTISITATDSAGTSLAEPCTLTVLPLPASAVGTFVGRFERSADVNADVGGRLDLTITAAGAFTAKLTQLGISTTNAVSSKGTLVTTVTSGVAVPVGATTFARTSGSPLSLSFSFDAGTNELAGLLTDPDSGGTTVLSGVRNVWNTKTNLPTSYAGYYTLALDLPAAAVGDASIPQGNGFASFTVANAGTLTWTGKTADGLAASAATVVGPAGQLVVFAPFITAGGSLTGTPVITADAASSFAANSLLGTLTWSKAKPTTATDRTYKAGFGPVTLTAAGSKYAPPAAGQVVMSLPNVDGNALISFVAGGLLSGQSPPMTFGIQNLNPLGTTQTVAVPLAGSMANPARVTFLLSATPQGQFTGAFTVKTPGTGKTIISRAASYYGMIVGQGSTFGGYGYFLLPQLPGTGETAATAPILSGQVILEQAQTP